MNVLGFIVIAFMISLYVILDGFDLGIAALLPFVARSARDRAAAMTAIGPFWNGNEVWLIAAGGTLFALFPQAYASSFSGFYLPFMVVLWLLMFRGVSMELRNHLKSDMWHGFWDAAFIASSALLIVFFGVALGNVIRGVPLDAGGFFQGTFGFLLNPYALLVGISALVMLLLHGAMWLTLRVEGPLAERTWVVAMRAFWLVCAFYIAATVATLVIRWPLALSIAIVLPVLSIVALASLGLMIRARRAMAAFVASSAFLATLLAAAAVTMFPYLLRAYPGGVSISVDSAAPGPATLATALTVAIAGIVAVLVYASIVLPRMIAQKITSGE